ncbi:nmrA-like family domain-containing protein 1 [Rana temporaria]|uniref:nmrA-like family domain-containing protein 1 n=1 Tax=Rana temporaria TaxID=8407 RepID=UPI001AAD2D3F|nr:nmrA-like family domain-containing protein 1 [Rana temporaria]
MACKKTITVFGATGAQGGSVVKALLQDKSFAVRAVTRDVTKPAAQKLKEAGAEVVSADLDNETSVKAALKGTYGAFVVTNFWEHMDKDKEVKQGKQIADLCKQLELKHVIYSGLENVQKLTGGKLEVPHFDSKGLVEEYFRQIKVPMTSVRLAFYFENFLTLCRPQKCQDGKTYQLVIPMGDIPMDGISVTDLGPIVCSVLKNPSEYAGKDIGLSADKLTIRQYAEIMSEVTGKTIVDSKITPEAYIKLDLPVVQEMNSMFLFYHMRPDRNVALTRKLNPNVKTFKQFMEANKEAFKDL